MSRCALLLLALTAIVTILGACQDDDPTGPGSASHITIFQPNTDEVWTSVSDTLTLQATVSNENDFVAGATVQWLSDRDGFLGTVTTADRGVATLVVPPLSRGTHLVTAAVSNGLLVTDAVVIHNILPVRAILDLPTASIDGVALRWSRSHEPDFASYEVRRWVDDEDDTAGEQVRLIHTIDDTTAVDALPPLAENVHYAVTVTIEGDLAADSRPRTVARPNGAIMPFLPYDAAHHPTEPIVYLLDRAEPASRIVAMNYLTRETVADRTLDHGFAQYLDVADNGFGVEVYIARYDDGISVLDGATLEEKEHVTMGHGIASVAADGLGHVYVSLGTGTWSVPTVRSYDRATWTVTSENGHYDWTRLECVPGGGLVEITMAISPPSRAHYVCDVDGRILDRDGWSSPTGGYVYHKILGLAPTGEYYVTHAWGSVYAADETGAYLGNLPRGTYSFNHFAFSGDGALIFAAPTDSRYALTYNFPALTGAAGLDLRGYPWRLFVHGEFLVAVSRPEMTAERVGLDVVRIDHGEVSAY